MCHSCLSTWGSDQLRRLNIFSFEHRRLRGDLILACNIIHGHLDLQQAPVERDLRGHDFKLRHRSFRLLRRKAASSATLPNLWNKLPIEMIHDSTLDTFKRLFELAWSSLFPSLPRLPCSFNLQFARFETVNSAAVFDQYIWVDLVCHMMRLGFVTSYRSTEKFHNGMHTMGSP